MISQLLGNYFVENGIISKELLDKILKEQNSTRVKLGTIAVADNYLTPEQAEEINQYQMQYDKRFGDIAIEKGYLTNIQLGTLLSKQGSPYMKFLQLLVENSDISISKVDEYIARFQKDYGFSDIEMNALKCDDLDIIVPIFAFAAKPYVTDLTALVLRNITRFISTDFYIGHIKKVESFPYSSLTVQRSTGQHTVYLAFACNNNNGFLNIASAFAKENFSTVTEDAFDAVGEFINCISGLFASDLSSRGIDIDMEPPVAYKDQIANGNAYIVPIYISGNEINLYIAVDSDINIGDEPLVLKSIKTAGSIKSEDSKGTAVIVDDSTMSRKILRNLLEEAGYTVVEEAVNGAEAIEAYRDFNPDFITLDITMPVMDGIEALKKIMEYDSSANVIMISAAGQQKKIVEALKIGASKFVTKPFDKEDVLKNIASFFE